MKNAIAIAALLATVTCLGAAGADKEVPPYIPVQGYLTEQATGNPIDNPSVIIRFSLWDEEAAGTGYELWSELYDGASAVSVVDGFFTVYLGMINSLYYEKLMYYSADISGIDPLLVGEPIDNLWLEIQAGLDAPMDRVQLASVPFAQEAQYCHQIGDVTEDDVQSKLDFYCGGSLFLRGWADGGPICEVDKQSDMGDAGVSVGVLLVSAGPGLELTPESTNDMPILRAAFGSTSGTTAEGNHLHDDDYQPLMDTQCPTGQVIHEIYPNGNVSCTPDNVGLITSVAAPLVATGGYLTLDQTGIQPRLSASICGAGDFITSIDPATGAAVCSTPVGKVYTAPAGGGVLINGSDEISADFDYVQARVNIGGNTADGTCGVGELMKGIDPASGAITCAADQTTGSSGGEIVSVTGISPIETEDDGLGHVDVSIKVGEGAGSVAPDDHSHTEFGTFALYTESITSIQGCVDGQVLKSTGGVWDCDNDINTNTNADTICTAGAGYYLDGSGACNPINFETYQTRIGTHDCVDNGIKRIDPATGVVTCADAYADGEGLSLTGHTFNVTFGDTAGTVAEGSHGHAGYAAEVHEHDWGNITSGMPGGFADGVDNVDDTVIWSEISGIVGTGASEVAQGSHGHAGYSTTGHEHAWGEITGMPAGFSDGVDDVNDSVAWSEISGIVGTGTSQVAQGSHGHAGYSTTGHEHAWGEITGMPGGFSDGVDNVDDSVTWSEISGIIGTTASSVAEGNHEHAWGDITSGMPGGFADGVDNVDDTVIWSEISGIVGTTTSSVAQGSHNHDSDYNSCADCESTFVNRTGDTMTGGLYIELDGSTVPVELISNGAANALTASSSGWAISGTGDTGGVWGSTGDGIGVFGSTGDSTGVAYGVRGESSSDQGRGVLGEASSTSGVTYGVFGLNYSPTGYGVYGYNKATTGVAYGVLGQTESSAGTAVAGIGGNIGVSGEGSSYGVRGETATATGNGVAGFNTSGSAESTGVLGSGNYGVAAWGAEAAFYVLGATGADYGLYVPASSNPNYGVRSYGNYYGVYGASNTTSGMVYGVYGYSTANSGIGVKGRANHASGTNIGVVGETESPAGMGVYGFADASSGVTYGVYGNVDSATGWGLYTPDNVGTEGEYKYSSAKAGTFVINPADLTPMFDGYDFTRFPNYLQGVSGSQFWYASIKLPDGATMSNYEILASDNGSCSVYGYLYTNYHDDSDNSNCYNNTGSTTTTPTAAGVHRLTLSGSLDTTATCNSNTYNPRVIDKTGPTSHVVYIVLNSSNTSCSFHRALIEYTYDTVGPQ